LLSKSLEALLVLSVTLILSFSLFFQAPIQNDVCGLNPLSDINLAIQAAVSVPFSNQSVKITISGVIIFKGNWIVFIGCSVPFVKLTDPNHIIIYYNSSAIEYKILLNSLHVLLPITLSISYEKNIKKIEITAI
jgi:hypothetical protein